MMGRRIVWGMVASALTVGAPARAQAAEPNASPAQAIKIGYVNVAKVFDGYQRTKASDTLLQQQGKQKESEMEGRLNELKKLRQSLELLNEDARDAKEREVEEKAEALRQFRNASARDLRRERDKIAKGLLDEIQRAIESYAKAGGFTLILDERSLLYGQPGYDLTDEILQAMNSRAAAPPAALPVAQKKP